MSCSCIAPTHAKPCHAMLSRVCRMRINKMLFSALTHIQSALICCARRIFQLQKYAMHVVPPLTFARICTDKCGMSAWSLRSRAHFSYGHINQLNPLNPYIADAIYWARVKERKAHTKTKTNIAKLTRH